MNKTKKILVSSIIGISLFAPLALKSVNVVNADKTDSNGYVTTGKFNPKYKKAFKQAAEDNKRSNKIIKKQSDKFAKNRDKNIEYNLDGSISKDKTNVAVANRYKKELPKLENQLKNLKKNSNQYNTLNNKVQMHKTVIDAIFGK